MTRLRQIVVGSAAAAFLMGGAVSQSFAVEPVDFTNNLSGASVGLPLGAAPPPGLYTGLESVYGAGQLHNAGNQNTAAGQVNINSAFVGAVPLVWATGWNILGGNLVLDVVQAFYSVTATGPGIQGPVFGNAGPPFVASIDFPTVANTTWGGALSWNLGSGWFGALGFAFEAPDGSRYNNIALGTLNPDYWSFEPTAALSYLANNWVLSANMAYFFNTASKGICCGFGSTLLPPNLNPGNGWVSGQEFYLDLTALYKFGKWEIGPVGKLVAQTTNDSPGNGFSCAALQAANAGLPVCGRAVQAGAGALVGYDFGPVDLQVWFTSDFTCQDSAACGTSIWTRLGFRIWGPEAPKPLVAKN